MNKEEKSIELIKNDKINIKGKEFDYSKVDAETRECMQQATQNIYLLREKTRKALGEQLSIVQKKLAGKNQYNGFFEKWYTGLGFKKDFVYDSINYYELLIANSENQMLQNLSISKVCEIAKLKEDEELQKEIIDKAPLDEMKTKQVAELVKEVSEKKEITEELIKEICDKTDKNNTNVTKFIKTTTSFIEELKDQKEKIKEDNLKAIIKLVEEVKELCLKVEK